MLRITNNSIEDEAQSTQAENQDAPSPASKTDNGGSIKNLSIVANLAKSKKSKLIKSKKSDLPKANFAKDNFRTDFLTPKAKKAFIHL